jgi:hypothetical protein
MYNDCEAVVVTQVAVVVAGEAGVMVWEHLDLCKSGSVVAEVGVVGAGGGGNRERRTEQLPPWLRVLGRHRAGSSQSVRATDHNNENPKIKRNAKIHA